MKVHHTAIVLDFESSAKLASIVGDYANGHLSEFYCSEVVIERNPIDLSPYQLGQEIELETEVLVHDARAQVVCVHVYKESIDLPFFGEPVVVVSTSRDTTIIQAQSMAHRLGLPFTPVNTILRGKVGYWDGNDWRFCRNIGAPYQKYSDTSADAAKAIRPKKTALQKRVLDFILSQGNSGATDWEVSCGTGILYNTVNPRRLELEKAGLVKKTQLRRKARGASTAAVYVASGIARQVDMFGGCNALSA